MRVTWRSPSTQGSPLVSDGTVQPHSFNSRFSTNSKNKGVYYPFINKLVSALEERENVIKNYETIKEEARVNMRKLKGKGQEEESDDEY